MRRQPTASTSPIRCAIYTRKSTDEGLEQEFNTLDAQRESAEMYIGSQQHEGWQCLPDHYDDGGFTGGNMDRPALERLLADIEAGKVDCVVVYKVDRLSRSLLDFARIMETFERHRVSFVSVTQQFNTSTSMGRSILNVLLSFAQFEREMISERTRDKIAAARRKGRWVGGRPILGYDIEGSKLVVNEAEAERVRVIFDLYLEYESLLQVVKELERRGWTNKRWTTRKGHEIGGRPFNKVNLYGLLTNYAYAGRVQYKGEVYEGQHQALVEPELWQRVQNVLSQNCREGGVRQRNRFGALLKGLLRCKACGCAMSPTHSTRNRTRRYRYYVCTKAQKRGWNTCPTKSIPAPEIEQFVVDQIKAAANDRTLLVDILARARSQGGNELRTLERELRATDRDLAAWNTEVRDLVMAIKPEDTHSAATARLADLQERIRVAERRATELREQTAALRNQCIEPSVALDGLRLLDGVWETLTTRERIKVVHLVVQRVEYDAVKGKVAITYRPAGLKMLAERKEQVA